MRFLKILVVVMGLLLVIGFVVLGFAISKKMQESSTTAHEVHAMEPTVLVPEGAKIVEIKTDNGILVMWLNFEEQDQVVFVNMKTGKIISQ